MVILSINDGSIDDVGSSGSSDNAIMTAAMTSDGQY